MRFISILVVMLIAGAAWAGPPLPHLATPDVARIAGRSCDAAIPWVETGEAAGKPSLQDPQTGYYLGTAYVSTYCEDEKVHYQGCADLQWDPTGTTIIYTVRWREKTQHGPGGPEWKKDLAKRCFNSSSWVT